jgi:GT2 family glycosyltransferase
VAEVEELADWARSMGAGIEIIKGELSDYEMACLYRACDCYVSPSAEGFGVPLVEAAMCGLPSVALSEGGARDIVTGETGYRVDSKWEPCVGQLPQIYPSSHSWPTCHLEDLKDAMRRAYANNWGELRLGAQSRAIQKFSRKPVGDTLLRVIEGIKPPAPSWKSGRAVPFIAVITTHNQKSSTNRLVQSLLSATLPYMIVIADDGSTDDTQDWADSHGFLFVRCDTGGNVSRNRQLAINALKRQFTFAEDPYVVFFDNDVEVSGDWWETLSRVMQARPDIGILAPVKTYGSDTQASAPQFDAPDAGTVQNVGNRLYFHCGSFPVLLERPLVYPDYVESACMVVRPEVWRSLEWDEQFPIFYEDVDYCLQARAAGWEVCATNAATVTHHAHTTSHTRAGQAEVSRMRFLKKWRNSL